MKFEPAVYEHVAKLIGKTPWEVSRSGKRRKKGKLEIEYLRTNIKRMMYASFKNQDYFIGSGVVEAGCKTVVGKLWIEASEGLALTCEIGEGEGKGKGK